MKNLKHMVYFPITIGMFAVCCLPASAQVSQTSQTPQGINYQAVARNANGNPLATQTVSVQFKIYKTNTPANGGTSVYDETHSNIITTPFGLFTLTIGMNPTTINSGVFSSIAWSSDKHFLEVWIDDDAGGPDPFVSMGTTQFMSVPYSLHSNTADSLTKGAGINPWTKTGSNVSLTTTTDKVGIGTASPQEKLHVVGKIIAEESMSPQLIISKTSMNTGFAGFRAEGNSGYWDMRHQNNTQKLYFSANNVDKVVFDSNGNVGIGTISPKSTLKVEGSMAGKFVEVTTGNYICTAKDYFVFVTTGLTMITLPLANSVDAGSVIIVRNNSSVNISVSRQLSDNLYLLSNMSGVISNVPIDKPGITGIAVRRFISDGISKWIEW